jgi:L-alanine-DL-glutamate epimerase-like enolase superfamily enzyme
VRLSARKATIQLAETFVISRSSQDSADVVYVELEHDGVTGYGEAAPIERYDQSADSALGYLEGLTDELGDDPWALEEIEARLPAGEPAARSAIDAALHDLQGKLARQPVWRLLGLRRSPRPAE